MESMKCQMEAGPMPPKVVKTHGRKVRPRAAEPEACLAVFSAARAVMMAWASRAAADALCYTTHRQTPPPKRSVHIPWVQNCRCHSKD